MTKIKGTKTKKEITSIIDKIIENLEKNKIINDELIFRLKSKNVFEERLFFNKINQSLRNKGIDIKFIEKVLIKLKKIKIEPDFVSALKLCKRRRIGPMRPESNRELFYKKDMGILARGGFSFDLSKRVLNLDLIEFKKLIKII